MAEPEACRVPAPVCRCALVALLGACAGQASERPQWRVQIETDAPVPQLGDRLLVEVLDDNGQLACGECQRQFGVLAPEQWDFTFGVVPPLNGQSLRIRARLYFSRRVGADGLPVGTQLIDAVGQLPDVAAADRVGIHLGLDCFGIASDPASHRTCDPRTGRLEPEPVLTAPLDRRPPLEDDSVCANVAGTQTVCIAGGPFVIGNQDRFTTDPDLAPFPERLVKVSSFALDAREFSVGTYRELVRSGLLEDAAVVQDPAALSSDPACTYLGPERASNDALPLSCISAPAAAAACAALGKRLPTEAEWEYAARSRGLRVRYPWGEDDAICAHAVIAVGRDIGVDPAPAELLIEEDTACRASAPGDAWGPRPSAALPDVTPLGIWELAGNLAEWTSDDFAPYSDDCWSNPAPPSAEPRCTAANVDGGPPSRSVRGGSWANQPFDAEPMRRANAYPDLENPIIGFRCAATL